MRLKQVFVPLLLCQFIIITGWVCVAKGPNFSYFAFYVAFLFVELAILEKFLPLNTRWAYTPASLLVDLKMFAGSLAFSKICSAAFGFLMAVSLGLQINWNERQGFHPALLLCFLLVFELIKYWHHRFSHEGTGRAGKFLWRLHMIHHVPDKIYTASNLLRHPVEHAINVALLPICLAYFIPISLLDFFVFHMFLVTTGAISHLNIDADFGLLNYVITTPATHSFHHSANPAEAKNYGITTPLLDIVFGTFIYRKNQYPTVLGVTDPEAKNLEMTNFFQSVIYPFFPAKREPR